MGKVGFYKIGFVFLVQLISFAAWGQSWSDSTVESYIREEALKVERYVDTQQRSLQEFIDKRNAEYDAFLEQEWREFQSYVTQQDPPEPRLKKPVVTSRKTKVPNRQLPCHEVVWPKNRIQSRSVAFPNGTPNVLGKFTGTFYQTPYTIRIDDTLRYKLDSVTDSSVLKVWRRMSDGSMTAMLQDCWALRKQFQLDDWGYMRLLERITEDIWGGACAEAVLMQVYLLARSGYVVVPAIRDNRLFLLVEFEETIPTGRYVSANGHKYLIVGAHVSDTCSNTRYRLSSGLMPKEGIVASVRQCAMPLLAYSPVAGYGIFRATHYPEVEVKIVSNQNILDYCSEYPVLNKQWDYYVYASLSKELKESLYPVLQSHMRDKTQKEAVDILLDFMQTAFLYKDDIAQFGYERPFFGDEIFLYSHNDCEDRAILFAILVRELLNMDVALVHFPADKNVGGHVATAVKFTDEDVPGGYFLVNKDKYVICDPTFFNQGAGACMSDYVKKSARLIVL